MIIDTNALSAYADGVPEAIALIDSSPAIYLSVISLGEYRYGIANSRKRKSHQEWLDEFMRVVVLLDITEPTTKCYAEIRTELRKPGMPIPVNDIWIAALSRQYELPVASRDAHFDKVQGLRRLSW